MKNYILRFFSVILAAVMLVVVLMCFETSGVYAAFNNRSAKGAKKMPRSRTIRIRAGKAVKINFGKKKHTGRFYYFKIKPKKTGTITFRNDYTRGDKIALCNEKKKVISRERKKCDDYYSYKGRHKYQKVVNYGVKKGKTYYIRVRGSSGKRKAKRRSYVGSVKWTNKGVSRSGYGVRKTKAKAIKRKKTVKELFAAGNKKAQWFKITNRQKKTKIMFRSSKNNGSIKVRIYFKSSGRWYNRTYSVYRHSGKNIITGTVSRKVKHTYYLKVFPDGKTSGSYSLKWK